MATAFEDLAADQTRRIYRDFLKGVPRRATKRKYAIDDATLDKVIGLYRKRTHPNDVGGTPLGPRDLLASRLETGSRATEGPVQAYSPRDIDHDSAERTHDALVELGETSAAERDTIRTETAKAVEDPEALNQQAREHAEKVRIAEQAGEAYRALAVRKHYEDFAEEDKKLVEAGKKQNAELAAQEAAYKTRELEERQKQFEQLKKELESKEGAATTPTPLGEEDLDTTTSMQVSENAQEIIDSHKLPAEEVPPPETETPPVLREKMGQPPVDPSAAHGSAPIGPGPAKEPGPLPKPGQAEGGEMTKTLKRSPQPCVEPLGPLPVIRPTMTKEEAREAWEKEDTKKVKVKKPSQDVKQPKVPTAETPHKPETEMEKALRQVREKGNK